MQRLYLAPHRFDSLPAFLDADPRALRVGVVPTATGVLEDRAALQLVPFTVMPHHNDPARQARHRAVLEQDAGRGRVVALADDQAIEVR